ncbi:DUF6036 family nucleotidyltransferase [Cohnella panacarvi]|uniref:DUF6036 family nucleotidyltransferase n=1 Tax=Cohnella panacarvi TaxID=400776 RepID=UPI00047B065C|nr:DUF6036 family nucleotidyltransferase [Cohnella panacarvi]
MDDMDAFEVFDQQEPYVTRDSILQLFEEVDKDLNGQPLIEVFVVGYSAIVLARKNNRGSNDVDIIPSRFSRVFSDHGLEVFDEHYFYLPKDYKTRAKAVEREYRSLLVKAVDPHDIWYTKLAAFRSKDKVDMIQMIRDKVVDPLVLDTMFANWNKHWFNDSPELEANYAEVRYHDSETPNP